MAATKPTSRQLQGHFDALRASKSHTGNETINIAAGNYGFGKRFAGAWDISHPSWVGATSTFYVYVDKDDNLVLDDTVGFPPLTTWIARIVVAGGIVIDIIDERAEVNGIVDAYQVAFDDTGMQIVTPADDIQEAIEILDAYVSNVAIGKNILKYIDFDVAGGIRNGLVDNTQINDSPAISFVNKKTGVGRVRYTASVPKDWVEGTNIVIKLFWSVPDNIVGNVEWRIRYRLLKSGTDNVDSAMNSVSFIQSTPGVANRLIDTENNLVIPSNHINSGNILIINIERDNSESDYNENARIHLIRLEYTGKGIE